MPWVTITQGARVDDDPPQGSAEDRLPHGASVDKDDCVDRLPHGATVFRLPHGPSVDELPHCGLPTNVSEFRLPHGVFEDRTSHGAWDTTAVLTVSSALRSASGHESGRNMRTFSAFTSPLAFLDDGVLTTPLLDDVLTTLLALLDDAAGRDVAHLAAGRMSVKMSSNRWMFLFCSLLEAAGLEETASK